ncbi:Alpha/Beta hydrolase protein [Xylariaceae sp. FL0016]|nr:Alpha/Beta hydrolase protein [Xylariaceae sp. FL0016]
MFIRSSIGALSLALQLVAARPAQLNQRQTDCDDVHIFISRGSDEDYPGRQISIVDAVCADITSCGYEDIIYPATLDDYCDSVYAGVTNGTAQITAYSESCPDSILVMTGYSQGAQVVGDILGGGGGDFGDCIQPESPALSPDSAPGSKIIATFFGDVRHVANQTYNTGTGTTENGIYPRNGTQLEDLNLYSDVLQSWCFQGDPVCAGGVLIYKHLQYFDVYTDAAAAWIESKL